MRSFVSFIWLLFAAALSNAAEDPNEEVKDKVNDKVESINETTYPYRESLDITPLPRNNLLVSFNFELESNYVNVSKTPGHLHYTTFPRSILTNLRKNKH